MKKKCTICGTKTENWEIVNGGPVRCWECGKKIRESEEAARKRAISRKRAKKPLKIVRLNMVAIVYADEFDEHEDENLLDEYFEAVLGKLRGKLPKGVERMVHGVVGVGVEEQRPIDDVLDEYPPYDNGQMFHTLT